MTKKAMFTDNNPNKFPWIGISLETGEIVKFLDESKNFPGMLYGFSLTTGNDSIENLKVFFEKTEFAPYDGVIEITVKEAR